MMSLAVKSRRKKARKPATRPAPDPALLLQWYDRHRRVLPWRAGAGEFADPYRVWLSEIMLQQTTVKAVAPTMRASSIASRRSSNCAAPLDDVLKLWAGLGYYARARNLHACAKAVAELHAANSRHRGRRCAGCPALAPRRRRSRRSRSQACSPVDGNIERVIARLHAIEDELPAAKPRIRALAEQLTPQHRAGDFAQGLMDLGATICTPKNPACALCPWIESCAARVRGDQESFPRKANKKAGALRRGAAFVARRKDGFILLRTRPEKGLLGGMTEVPTTEWTRDFDADAALSCAPLQGTWRRLPGVVNHVFTHFPLELTVYTAELPARTPAPEGMRWVAPGHLAEAALPTVMRKVILHKAS